MPGKDLEYFKELHKKLVLEGKRPAEDTEDHDIVEEVKEVIEEVKEVKEVKEKTSEE